MNIPKFFFSFLTFGLLGYLVPKVAGIVLYFLDMITSIQSLGFSPLVSQWVVSYTSTLSVLFLGFVIYRVYSHFSSNI